MLRVAVTVARCRRAPWRWSTSSTNRGAWNCIQSARWLGSRAKALEDLSELDELLEDELIEEETHATQLQRILTEFGVKSREELLKGEPGELEVPAPPEEFPETGKEARVQLLQEQLQELDEMLEDELIEEEVHTEQRKHLLAALAREGHQPR
eukprot:s760_g13.t1